MAIRSGNSHRRYSSLLPLRGRGSILVVVLWSLCLLSAFAVILGYQVRQKAVLAKRLDERSRLHFIAEAGVKTAISQLKKEPENNFDALQDSWSSNPAVFRNIRVSGGAVDVCYDYIDEKSGAAGLRYGLSDEESKININSANEDMLLILERLVMSVSGYGQAEAQEIAASVIDWRDADDSSLVFGSAERQYYEGLQQPYTAKNAAFEAPEELLLVKGIDENVYGKIKNYVTIYGTGRININTASRVVLSALGLDEAVISKIVDFRAGDDQISGTADDNIFTQSSDIVPQLSAYAHLSADEAAQLSTITSRHLGVKSENFSARCTVKLGNNMDTSGVSCIVSRNGKILYWREP